MAAEAAPVSVTLHLVGGVKARTVLPADSEILRELFEVAARAANGHPKLLQIPTEGGHSATSFASDRLIAIETSPPVIIEEPEDEASEPPHPAELEADEGPLRGATHRSPPRVFSAHGAPREEADSTVDLEALSFVQVTDFLTPDEERQLLASTLGNQGPPDPSLTERMKGRLKLLLPQLLASFDPGLHESSGPAFEALSDGSTRGEAVSTSGGLTCTYSYRRDPGRGSGGELELRLGSDLQPVSPVDRAMLIYPTASLVSAHPVRCPSGSFSDSHFSLTWGIEL